MSQIQQLIEHVCGQPEFDEDKAFEGLEKVIDYDWQKRFVLLLGRLADNEGFHFTVTADSLEEALDKIGEDPALYLDENQTPA